jgi:hemolysin activation/secretion protein
MPYMYSSYLSSVIEEGLGGAKSLRGILRNRLIGEGIAYGNVEFRWKFLKGVLWKQNMYLALNPFVDGGLVVQKVWVDQSLVPPGENIPDYFTGQKESFHFSTGCGLHFALNENFVVAADVGYALSGQDGGLGVYIGINWLF